MCHPVGADIKNSKAVIPAKFSTSFCSCLRMKLGGINPISQQENTLGSESPLDEIIMNPLCNNPDQGSPSIGRPFQPFRKSDQQAITQYAQLNCLLGPEIRNHK